MLELARPLALFALALPLLVLALARWLAHPLPLATGTLAVWLRTQARAARRSERVRARIPPAVWVLAFGLLCGALALAGPRLRVRREPVLWRVVVDRSPSMYLVEQDGTRLARALALCEPWLRERERDGDRIAWCAPNGSRLERVESTEFPAAWLEVPRIPRADPDWVRFDSVGDVWLCDRAPELARAHAGLFASGGSAHTGAIAVDGTTRIDWDGTRLVEVAHGAAAARVCVDARAGALPEPLMRMLGAWGAARGATIESSAAPAACELVVRSTHAGERRAVMAARDGWSLRGEAGGPVASVDADGDLESWLVADDPTRAALVSFGPGRVESAWISVEEPRGDPAAFAVSWGKLFDRALLPAAGVIEFSERVAAGEPRVDAPRALDARGHAPLEPWLTLAALCSTLFALWLAARR